MEVVKIKQKGILGCDLQPAIYTAFSVELGVEKACAP